MDLLILGGTIFLGRALVAAALEQGHRVTLFNRGRSHPGLFPAVEELHGDRAADLSALHGRRWDAVIDTSGYLPRVVRQSAELLAGAVAHYAFVSTLSVYADSSVPDQDETAALATLDDPTVEAVTGETYGPLKALCEAAVTAALPGRALIVRPGLIVGPYDPSDRFTYWPWRVAQGGAVLAPGRAEREIEFIDVRDLAEWIVRMVTAGRTGVYNAVGPAPRPTMGDLLAAAQAASGAAVRIIWVDEAFLLAREVAPWSELPLWLPASDPQFAGFFATNIDRALAAGLTFRPIAETVRATLEWAIARPADQAWRAGLSREREAALLAEWQRNA